MTFRRLARAVGLVSASAGATVLARALVGRHRAIRVVPPELRHPMLYVPQPLSPLVLRVRRRIRHRPTPLAPGIAAERRTLPSRGEHPPVDVYVYDGPARPPRSGALLWIHGGGFVMGDPVTYHDVCSRFARELGILVVSVDYRLAPDHPFPAGLEDCYTALRCLHDQATEFGVDPDRIAVGGDSAGGGLSACLVQLALDRGEVALCFQLLIYPMLDDRTVLRADHAGTGLLMWTPRSNRFGWTAYLGHPPREVEDRPYVAAARRQDLAGLPPAWIGVGDIDLFFAEDLTYAKRLQAAGVPCELYVEHGLYHGADGLREATAEVARSFRNRAVAALLPVIGDAKNASVTATST